MFRQGLRTASTFVGRLRPRTQAGHAAEPRREVETASLVVAVGARFALLHCIVASLVYALSYLHVIQSGVSEC